MGIHIGRVYTRSGDSGETGLVGGKRVPKDDLRVECYGTLDELNACLGLARGAARDRESQELLLRLQNEVFDLGNELATPPESFKAGMLCATPEAVAALEERIDRANQGLAPLRSFVLPGGGGEGGEAAAFLHLARTVCRRAERAMVGLARRETVRPEALAYVNRLSDLLFVLARRAAGPGGEELWQGGLRAAGRPAGEESSGGA